MPENWCNSFMNSPHCILFIFSSTICGKESLKTCKLHWNEPNLPVWICERYCSSGAESKPYWSQWQQNVKKTVNTMFQANRQRIVKQMAQEVGHCLGKHLLKQKIFVFDRKQLLMLKWQHKNVKLIKITHLGDALNQSVKWHSCMMYSK